MVEGFFGDRKAHIPNSSLTCPPGKRSSDARGLFFFSLLVDGPRSVPCFCLGHPGSVQCSVGDQNYDPTTPVFPEYSGSTLGNLEVILRLDLKQTPKGYTEFSFNGSLKAFLTSFILVFTA